MSANIMKSGLVNGASAFVCLVSLTLGAASADPVLVVSPAAAKEVEGDIFVQPPGSGTIRLQALYPAADFAGLPESQRLLSGISQRADAKQTTPVTVDFPNIKIWASTTSLDEVTPVFDDNHGADKTLVHDGAYSFSYLGSGPPAGPRDFAPATPFQTLFAYDPSQGNLLLEFAIFEAAGTSVVQDWQTTSVARYVGNGAGGNPNGSTGTTFDFVPIRRFEFVPEPSAGILAGLALAGLLLIGRRSRR